MWLVCFRIIKRFNFRYRLLNHLRMWHLLIYRLTVNLRLLNNLRLLYILRLFNILRLLYILRLFNILWLLYILRLFNILYRRLINWLTVRWNYMRRILHHMRLNWNTLILNNSLSWLKI